MSPRIITSRFHEPKAWTRAVRGFLFLDSIRSFTKEQNSFFSDKNKTTPMGFEPTRAEHIGLAVQRLNHSATVSLALSK